MKVAAFLILFPLLGDCAALAPDALSLFRKPGVPDALFAKVESGIPLSLPDVVILSRADVSKGAIVDYLYSFGRHFHLTAADVWQLRRQGVSPDLIDYMSSPASHPSPFGF
jgi:hypothetical protein